MKTLAFTFTIWLASTPVLAQSSSGQSAAGAATDANVTSYDFEDTLVQGDLVSHNGEILHARPRPEKASLIRIREHFIDRLLASSWDI